MALPPDRHVHTEWSWDAPRGSMERTCARALELGLASVAFTDHADFTPASALVGDPDTPERSDRLNGAGELTPRLLDLDGYRKSLDRCRQLFPDLEIISGVELSEPHRHPGPAATLLTGGGFDWVVSGVHAFHTGEEGSYLAVSRRYRQCSAEEVVYEYMAEVIAMIDGWEHFDVLAHIDYPARSWPPSLRPFPTERFEEPYRAVLRALAAGGRALEFNTRVPLDPVVIQWWRQEGGTAVSFGSDAHDPLSLARGFSEATAVVESIGFRPGRHRHDVWTLA
jgi:histidinol-phosphatase (PHP family)